MAKITPAEARIVASCERPKGIQHLRAALGWEPFDEADKPAQAILLDFHYDNLMFCVKKGFPWQQACTFVDMAAVIAEQCKGKTLNEAIRIYQKQCQLYSSSTSERFIKQFTEFFFETFLHHYQLYQYVFNKEQERMIVKINAQVETPPSPLPFTESKPLKVWEYEQKYKDVELAEEKRKKEQEEEELQIKLKQEEARQKALEKLQNVEHPLEKEALAELINEIAREHISAAGHAIKLLIDHTAEDLEFKLRKTSIPRPQELVLEDADITEEERECLSTLAPLPKFGADHSPPPRHKTRTPLSASRKNKDKSAKKEKSRGSSRASVRSRAK